MCRLGESSPPSPHFLCSRTLICPKKTTEKSFLGHLKLWQSAVSQFHKEMHSGVSRAQRFYLHVPHMAMVHVLDIHRFDVQAIG